MVQSILGSAAAMVANHSESPHCTESADTARLRLSQALSEVVAQGVSLVDLRGPLLPPLSLLLPLMAPLKVKSLGGSTRPSGSTPAGIQQHPAEAPLTGHGSERGGAPPGRQLKQDAAASSSAGGSRPPRASARNRPDCPGMGAAAPQRSARPGTSMPSHDTTSTSAAEQPGQQGQQALATSTAHSAPPEGQASDGVVLQLPLLGHVSFSDGRSIPVVLGPDGAPRYVLSPGNR